MMNLCYCEGLMRARPSCSSAAAASTASETVTRKRKCTATVTTDKKKARHWSVLGFFICLTSSLFSHLQSMYAQNMALPHLLLCTVLWPHAAAAGPSCSIWSISPTTGPTAANPPHVPAEGKWNRLTPYHCYVDSVSNWVMNWIFADSCRIVTRFMAVWRSNRIVAWVVMIWLVHPSVHTWVRACSSGGILRSACHWLHYR